MTRLTAPRLTALSLAAVLAMAPSAGAVAAGVAAAQPPAAPTSPDDGTWPPPGVHRQTEGGVTLPRLLHDVGPQYTSEAMREKIQGKVSLECVVEADGTVTRVHVSRALDKLFGLDEAAVRAAKQWRFTPGTKDNVAVPVLITIDMAFTLGDAPPPFTWPEPFVATGDPAIDASDWIEEVSDVSGLRIRAARPNGWTVRKDVSGSRLISFQSTGGSGTRIFFIENPKPARFQVGRSLTVDMLQELAAATRQGMTTPAGAAQVMGVGQTRLADRVWIWVDLSLPTLDTSHLPPALSGLTQASVDGARMWTFTTTAGSQEVAVGCVALRSRNASRSDALQELRQAGAEFAAMLKRVSIQER